jgi:hypothetical protein
MPWVGLEPTIPALKQGKAVYDLDRGAIVIGKLSITLAFSMKKLRKSKRNLSHDS